MKTIEERLWDYIDGNSSSEEKITIEQLLQSDPSVKQLHEEFLAVNNALKFSELEEPSMRFTKNVMEQVALEPAPKALQTKVDSRIIKVIAGFFIGSLSLLVGFSLFQMDWSAGFEGFDLNVPSVDWSKYFGSSVVQGALIVLVIATLAVIDRYRHWRKVSHQ